MFEDSKVHDECCVKSVSIRRYSGPHFSRIFSHSDWIRRDTKYLSVFSPNAGKCGKMWTRITPNTDTFYAAKEQEITFSGHPFVILGEKLLDYTHGVNVNYVNKEYLKTEKILKSALTFQKNYFYLLQNDEKCFLLLLLKSSFRSQDI